MAKAKSKVKKKSSAAKSPAAKARTKKTARAASGPTDPIAAALWRRRQALLGC